MLYASRLICAFVLAVTASVTQAQTLQVGDYFRPNGTDVSGVVGNSATYRRSPCPAMNTLANHGYLPRNGMDITPDMLKTAVMEVFNIASDLADSLVSGLPDSTSLDILGTHNMIEHDASMVHADVFFGADPMDTDTSLLDDLIGRADSSGRISVSAVSAVRKARLASCWANNPTCTFGTSQMSVAYTESCTFLLAFGAKYSDSSISVDHARSFLVDERIPDDFVKAESQVTLWDVSVLSGQLEWNGWFF